MKIIDLRRLRPPDQMSSVWRSVLLPLLVPPALIYGGAMWLWRRLPAHAVGVGVPVVSVGSILVGGTGKTPLVILIVEGLQRMGLKPCIISRGYMRRSKRSPLVVSDGNKFVASVGEAGDEPYLMAKRVPGVGVVVGGDRIAAAREAQARLQPDVFVLDDGFQARGIAKAVEILTVDAASLRGRQHMLPAGRLREAWTQIRPEYMVVVLVQSGEPEPDAEALGRFGGGLVFRAVYEEALVLDGASKAVDIGTVRRARALLLSGIARPANFESTCRQAGIDAVVSVRVDDHHWYDKRDVGRVLGLMESHGCSQLVTTDKDFNRLPTSLMERAWIVRANLNLSDPQRFWDALQERMRGRS